LVLVKPNHNIRFSLKQLFPLQPLFGQVLNLIQKFKKKHLHQINDEGVYGGEK
jgi:hypothetical protein